MSRIKNLAFDAALGARIRTARVGADLSQHALGRAIGVSFQQVQKYEAGRDRVSAETLMRISNAIGVSPARLVDDKVVALARGGLDGLSVETMLGLSAAVGAPPLRFIQAAVTDAAPATAAQSLSEAA